MIKIDIKLPNSQSCVIFGDAGDNIMALLRDNGYDITAYCGGGKKCGKCRVNINGSCVLACETELLADCVISFISLQGEVNVDRNTINAGANELNVAAISAEIADDLATGNDIALAIDVGSTTLALAVVEISNGRVLNVETANNTQSAYGSDIISRIKFCRDGGLGALHSAVVEQINNLIKRVSDNYPSKTIRHMAVSGNATMLHLLLNIDCSSMGEAPYTAIFLDKRRLSAKEVGINLDCDIITMPSISSFVGSDIVAGMLYLGNPSADKYNILIDLGTNAEISVYSAEKCICTAAAAGACFEGANIECGMSATNGAICNYKHIKAVDRHHKGELTVSSAVISTIGGVEPCGICGSGLMDIVSAILENDIIDEGGYMKGDDKYFITSDIYISQRDIREFQLAKSAIRAGIESLLLMLRIGVEDIENLYLAGGFAMNIDIDSAVICQIIPENLALVCHSVGNSSLWGAIKFALESDQTNDIVSMAKYVDLASEPIFSDMFVNYMSFEKT